MSMNYSQYLATWPARIEAAIGFVLFVLWVLNALNDQAGTGAFLYDVWDANQVPTDQWFTHYLQWEPGRYQ